jgi:enoyl-CoA hydratase/carnithine racemase
VIRNAQTAAGVVTVTIDHPPTNLVDGPFIGALIELLDRCEADPDVRVLLFRSADPDFFLMHGDVEAILAVPVGATTPVARPNAAAATFDRLRSSRLVSIGLLDGAARGGGCEFLSALDLRIGSPRAVVGQPEVAMGILPGAGGTARWPRMVGRGRALEILLTGRDIAAPELMQLGWLDRLVGRGELDGEGDRLARRIAAMPGASIAAVKRVVDATLTPFDTPLTAESAELAALMSAGAQQVPMAAFLRAGGQTRDGERNGIEPLIQALTEALAEARTDARTDPLGSA